MTHAVLVPVVRPAVLAGTMVLLVPLLLLLVLQLVPLVPLLRDSAVPVTV